MVTPYRVKQLQMREEAILDAAHVLLGKFGYDAMTMDDVAAEVGIAKASLYKHFESKEKLAARTMVRLFDRTVERLDDLPKSTGAYEKLRAMLEWALRERLHGGIPHLPSTSVSLEQSLMTDESYLASLFALNASLSQLVEEAKREGKLSKTLPTDYIVTAIYARTCDPTLEYMQRGKNYRDNEIVEHMLEAFFAGVSHRARA
jgi:AcrR family transcriptional regulator